MGNRFAPQNMINNQYFLLSAQAATTYYGCTSSATDSTTVAIIVIVILVSRRGWGRLVIAISRLLAVHWLPIRRLSIGWLPIRWRRRLLPIVIRIVVLGGIRVVSHSLICKFIYIITSPSMNIKSSNRVCSILN